MRYASPPAAPLGEAGGRVTAEPDLAGVPARGIAPHIPGGLIASGSQVHQAGVFLASGDCACIDRFAFGLFKTARACGFPPPALADTFESVIPRRAGPFSS